MAYNLNQLLSTLRDIILASLIKLGLMPWLTRLVRAYIQLQLPGRNQPPTPNSTPQNSEATARFQNHTSSSTWYAWFNDNINDFYTTDPSETAQPLDPTDLVNSLLDNQVTLWHHPEFAPWLVGLIEPDFYQWPAEIPLDAELTEPQQVSAPATRHKLTQALSNLPPDLIQNIHIQELVLIYLGAGYEILEQLNKTPLAQQSSQERAKRHQECYEKQTASNNINNVNSQEDTDPNLNLNPGE